MDWVASMHRHPWHAKNHCNVTFPHFVTREWSPMHLAGAFPPPPPPPLALVVHRSQPDSMERSTWFEDLLMFASMPSHG